MFASHRRAYMHRLAELSWPLPSNELILPTQLLHRTASSNFTRIDTFTVAEDHCGSFAWQGGRAVLHTLTNPWAARTWSRRTFGDRKLKQNPCTRTMISEFVCHVAHEPELANS